MPERTKNTMVPWDDSFPKQVVHIASMSRPVENWFWLDVVWYGMESTMNGSVPVVAKEPGETNNWLAGESFVHKGHPVLGAVNGYGDESTALRYISDRNKVWTL